MPTTRSGITTGGDSADGKRKMKMDVDESKRKRHEKDANAASKAKAPSAAKVQVKSPSSSILEKGIIYFFVRARVTDADAPQQSDAPGSAAEVARAYMILRPLDVDSHNATARLLAVPKKTLPTRGGQRLIAFVEKAGADFSALRDEFLAGGERETKTRGTRHVPAATPVARGVYAITTTGGGESHLAYMLTLPRGGEGEEGGEEPALGEVQKSMGLRDRASWIISTRNPAFPPPERAVPQQPEYPKEYDSPLPCKPQIREASEANNRCTLQFNRRLRLLPLDWNSSSAPRLFRYTDSTGRGEVRHRQGNGTPGGRNRARDEPQGRAHAA